MSHRIATFTRVVPAVVDLSVIAFGIGLVLVSRHAFAFTAATSCLFGAAMISNGIFVAGNPLHGLHRLAMFYVLVPACFAAEIPRGAEVRRVVTISFAADCIGLSHTWLQVSNLDPNGHRGLTQRVFVLTLTGWYGYAGVSLLRHPAPSPAAALGMVNGLPTPNQAQPPRITQSTTNASGGYESVATGRQPAVSNRPL